MKAGAGEWSPAIAEEIAAAAGIVLREPHWRAITLCREICAREGAVPSVRRIGAPADLEPLFPEICGHVPQERSNS